jgi:hypothetical protein
MVTVDTFTIKSPDGTVIQEWKEAPVSLMVGDSLQVTFTLTINDQSQAVDTTEREEVVEPTLECAECLAPHTRVDDYLCERCRNQQAVFTDEPQKGNHEGKGRLLRRWSHRRALSSARAT